MIFRGNFFKGILVARLSYTIYELTIKFICSVHNTIIAVKKLLYNYTLYYNYLAIVVSVHVQLNSHLHHLGYTIQNLDPD